MDKLTDKKQVPLLAVGEPIPIYLDEPMARKVKEPTEWDKSKFLEVDQSTKQLYETVSPSVIYIRSYDKDNKLKSTASGFAIENGLFATAAHVVHGKDRVTIETAQGEVLPVMTIDRDDKHDVAILKALTSPHGKVPVLELELSDTQFKNQQVYSFGHPRGLKPTYVSPGKVIGSETVYKNKVEEFADARKVNQGLDNKINELRPKLVEAYINESNTTREGYYHRRETVLSMHTERGCSGGPLVNNHGRVVGLSCDAFARKTKIGLSNAVTGMASVEYLRALLKNNHRD